MRQRWGWQGWLGWGQHREHPRAHGCTQREALVGWGHSMGMGVALGSPVGSAGTGHHSCARRHAPLQDGPVSSAAQTAPTWLQMHTFPRAALHCPTPSALLCKPSAQPLGTQHCPPPRPKPTPGLRGGPDLTSYGSRALWGIPTAPLPSRLTSLLPRQERSLSAEQCSPSLP